MREKLKPIVEGVIFKSTVIILIITNSIILGLQTIENVTDEQLRILKILDNIFLTIFIIEVSLRIYVHRISYFKNAWNIFDFAIISVALLPALEVFGAFRAFRVLKVLRLISSVPALRNVVNSLLSAIPGMLSVFSIMIIFYYIFSVIGTHLYGETFPQWFGSIGKTMFTLFQVMTLEGWSMDIVRPVMDVYTSAWAFFILFILVTTFTTLNLFIAIIVNAMHISNNESAEESREKIKESLSKEMKEMEKRIIKNMNKN